MVTQTRSKKTSWRGISIFISIVIVSGLLLTVSGKMENPFSVFPTIVNLITTGNQNGGENPNGGFGRDGGQNAGTTTQGQGQAPTQGRGGPGRGGQATNTGTNAAGQPPVSGTAGQSQGQPQGQGPDQRGGQDAINWDQYGGVLFDLWYIAACTAVVILISRFIKLLQRRTKRKAIGPVLSRT